MTEQMDAAENGAGRQGGENGGRKALILVGLAGALLAAVLYGIFGSGGKETASASCPVGVRAASAIAPLAKGQVAALNVSKTPKPAVDISFDGPASEKLSLASFRGKTVLLNLWATWCVPCRAEMPALDRLQGELGGADFEVVAVNIDTARLERRKAFLDSAGVSRLALYTDEKAGVFQTLRQAGKVIGLPTTILIDAQGCELGVMPGAAEWDSPEAVALLRAAIRSGKEPQAAK